MKWEPRKAWDVLLTAYFEEFTKKDKVTLYFVSRLDTDSKTKYEIFVDEYTKKNGVTLSSLPKVVLLNAMFPETKLPSLYKSVDCFVLPSHGEGWGLPLIEAMSMSLPVIATNWSGPTGFMNEDNSFLVNIDGLEDAPIAGHKWATPNLAQLKQQMRKVYRQKPEVSKKAKKARKEISKKFSLNAIGDLVIEKLKEIQPTIPAVRENKTRKQSESTSTTPSSWYNTNPPSWTSNWGSNIGSQQQQEYVDVNGKKKFRIKINNNA